MFAGCAESEGAEWSAPQCPFRIEYISAVLDEIRLEVLAAFFSVPRGGAETGGILLGRFEDGRLAISDYTPVECEHAFGPSYTLSENDLARFRDLLASAATNPEDRRPVGWYHSHTRSEIFLSEPDLEIFRRYFPEPWQVSLVLRPHTFLPARAGFFFREAGGAIHSEACYREITLDPLSMAQTHDSTPEPGPPGPGAPPPLGVTAVKPPPAFPLEAAPPESPPFDDVFDPVSSPEAEAELASESQPEAEPEPASQPEPESEPEPELESEPEPVVIDLPCPKFLEVSPERPSRLRPLIPIAAVLALAAVGLGTRPYWSPSLTAGAGHTSGSPTNLPAPPPATPVAPPAAVSPKVAAAADHYARGRELLQKQRFTQAIQQLSEALKLDPTLATAFNARGYAHLRLRHYPQAKADFEQALKLDPSYANARTNLAAVRGRLGQARPNSR